MIIMKVSKIVKRSIIWRMHLPMQINGEVQNGIEAQAIDTRNTIVLQQGNKNIKPNFTWESNLWLYKECHTHNFMKNNN